MGRAAFNVHKADGRCIVASEPSSDGGWTTPYGVSVDRIKEVRRMPAKEGYCVKCKTKREIKDAQDITMKNGRPATQGTCPVCSTKIFRIGKS